MQHPEAKVKKLCRGYALFMNWFNGVLAPLCGGDQVVHGRRRAAHRMDRGRVTGHT